MIIGTLELVSCSMCDSLIFIILKLIQHSTAIHLFNPVFNAHSLSAMVEYTLRTPVIYIQTRKEQL